ncbi:MAG: efflux RND transporter periplasmic adaptor subunit, partial [Candidatus Eisenbacteria bacterium]|nr:efflux RND transporter periplasmic adaptor subunit [Candidatus Eisenbacteria bacterium]
KFTGSLLPSSQFVVAPKVAGRLEKLCVNIGDSVQKGQLIAVLDSQEYAQEVEQARAELKVKKATVVACDSSRNVAKREFERVKTLHEKKIASGSELDQAEANHEAADANYIVAVAGVEQKEAALKAAEVRLSFTQIQASWEDGNDTRVVGERYVDEGAMLRANDSIVSVLDIDSLMAVIHVTEEDYFRVRVGQSVSLTTRAYPGREFAGKVARMAPALKETSRAARVEVVVPNPEHTLRPGVFVQAEIELESHEGATVVPVSALTKRDGNLGVFLLEQKDMKVRFVPVETGIRTAEFAEVVRPSLDGHVVTLGHHLLEDGSAVIVPESSPVSEATKSAGADTSAGGQLSARGRP